EGLRMDDPVAVALKRRAQAARLLGTRAAPGLVRADGKRRQPPLLLLPHRSLEGVGNASCNLGHAASVLVAPAGNERPFRPCPDRTPTHQGRGFFPPPSRSTLPEIVCLDWSDSAPICR